MVRTLLVHRNSGRRNYVCKYANDLWWHRFNFYYFKWRNYRLAGLSYIWESASSISGPWTVIDTVVTAINTGTITATTYYKCVVGCSFSAAAIQLQILW